MFCANEIHVLTSKKKADFLTPLKDVLSKKADLPKLVLHLRNKVGHICIGVEWYTHPVITKGKSR